MKTYNDLNITYQGGILKVFNDDLWSLDGCPEYITGEFNCSYNKLKSLVGGPKEVDGDYDCTDNPLSNLIGCASHISGELYCYDTAITSLVGIHKIIKSCKSIAFGELEIKEGGIGLLLINNVTNISRSTKPFRIIKKYLGTGTKGMMECRAELIKEGYEQHAKL